jgi:hypothetical protein
VRGSWRLGDGAKWHVAAWFEKEPLDLPELPGSVIFATGDAKRGPFAIITREEA